MSFAPDSATLEDMDVSGGATSLFELISSLKAGNDVPVPSNVEAKDVWRVKFRGEPSFRHVNRIAIFRDYLDSVLPGGLEPVGAERGSVVVLFAQHDGTADFARLSQDLIGRVGMFEDIAGVLGVSCLEFGGVVVEFPAQSCGA